MTDNVYAIILAAGSGSRMGSPKWSLPFGETSLLSHVCGLYSGLGIKIFAVVDKKAEKELEKPGSQYSLPSGVNVIANPKPERGMFSSVQLGIDAAMSQGANAVLVHPVDIPLVQKETVSALLQSKKGKIRIPVFEDKQGHPVFIDGSIAVWIPDAPSKGNLRDILLKHETQIERIAVNDAGILKDMDTKEDYERLKKQG
jgi:molybdenum cofactor cytidylyltransferase